MARRIVVISSYNDEPTGELLKKSIAELSVRRLLAEWVVKGVSIRRRKVREVSLNSLPVAREGTHPTYIPEFLPPAEVENCRFIPPQSTERPSIAGIRAGWDWSREQVPALTA